MWSGMAGAAVGSGIVVMVIRRCWYGINVDTAAGTVDELRGSVIPSCWGRNVSRPGSGLLLPSRLVENRGSMSPDERLSPGGGWRVADAFDTRAAASDQFSGPAPRVLSIDESAFKKRFQYHTIVSAPEQRRILELVEGRNQRSATQALYALPEPWRNTVDTVVIDMFWPFRLAIEDVLPDARIVADKFHVIRAVDNAAQKVRVRHGRRVTVVGRDGGLSRQHNPRFDPKVWRSRWLFMRRQHKLTPVEQAGLDQLFALHPEIGVAWWLKEAFAHIYQAPNRKEAEQRLDIWIHHVTESGLPEFTNLWRTLNNWREPILNYHDDPQTNAYAEGITNKIKVMKRRGYGHRQPHRYRAKVLATTRHQPQEPPPTA